MQGFIRSGKSNSFVDSREKIGNFYHPGGLIQDCKEFLVFSSFLYFLFLFQKVVNQRAPCPKLKNVFNYLVLKEWPVPSFVPPVGQENMMYF